MRSEVVTCRNKDRHMMGAFVVSKIFAVFFMTIILSTTLHGFQDPLSSASIVFPLAENSLLLDIVKAGKRLIAVGERGHILYSDDDGKTWIQAKVPAREMLTAVTFPTVENGWAVGHSGLILVSHDAGETWEKQLDGNQANAIIFDAYSRAVENKKKTLVNALENEQDLFALEVEDLEYSLDGAKADLADGPNRPFLDVWFKNEQEGIAVGAFGLIVRTKDGGRNWASPAGALKNPEGFHYNAIEDIDGILFIAGEAGLVLRSADSGDTWEVLTTPYQGSFFNIAGDHRCVTLLGLRGNAVTSCDNGDSWVTVASATTSSLTFAKILDNGCLLVSQYGKQLLISNQERTRLTPLSGTNGAPVTAFVLGENSTLTAVGLSGICRFTNLNLIIKER